MVESRHEGAQGNDPQVAQIEAVAQQASTVSPETVTGFQVTSTPRGWRVHPHRIAGPRRRIEDNDFRHEGKRGTISSIGIGKYVWEPCAQ